MLAVLIGRMVLAPISAHCDGTVQLDESGLPSAMNRANLRQIVSD
jgi:hypothetical protein